MKQRFRIMRSEDRTRMSRAHLAVHVERLRDREASLMTIVEAGREQLARVRKEIKRMKDQGQ